MKVTFSLTALALLASVACSSGGTGAIPGGGKINPATVKRAYNGTASVGDFLSITVDSTAKTIAYTNHSNGDTGIATYSVNADGSYALQDPKKNLVSAYEVPGYALVIAAEKVGPNHASPALITAVESGPISPATFKNQTYNYLQFRTAAGGFESGAISIDATGNGSGTSYWPFGASNGGGSSPFHTLSGISVAAAKQDPSGTFFTIGDQGQSDYIFGTANGQFLVDTPNGAILGFKQAASSAFDASYAGTYGAMYFEKTNAQTMAGNIETGAGTLKQATITIDASAHLTMRNSDGSGGLTATLTPVADSANLVGPGKLTNNCPGLFTFRLTTPTGQQDVFVAFQGRALLFGSFTSGLAVAGPSTYSYAYGVGMH